MKFENIDINELLPDAKNPRKDLKPDDPEFNKIATSIEKFGFLEPIVFNTRTKKILGGHQRIKTLKHRGVSELHIIKLGAYSWGFTDDELKELTPSEENAANIALNKAQGDWDLDQLIINLQELRGLDFDIELTGFDDGELDEMFPPEMKEVDEDDFEPPAEVKTDIKRGDIIQLGRHRLMCGDAQDIPSIKKLLDGIIPDLLYYDPPYEDMKLWDCYYKSPKALVFSDARHIKDAMKIGNKYEYIYEFVWDTVISWYLNNRPLCRHRSAFICQNTPDYDSDAAVINDGKLRNDSKKNSNLGEYTYQPLPEGQVRLTTCYQKSKATLPAEHGKPIEWIAPIIAGTKSNTVLDLFGGSGSTLIACDQIGATCYIVELDPQKCQCIVDRYKLSNR